ncbi:hypothetical protein DPMN_071669 [Dreissena polymorpha]|uniref:Uncharacterized protein n=1 Tax=Dreissena polymorpha TaxID=45954 RepID=A0A9D4BWG0_DREPO|nr:hypothetical protein DPMN_071669 [Dreissena polymorpha]
MGEVIDEKKLEIVIKEHDSTDIDGNVIGKSKQLGLSNATKAIDTDLNQTFVNKHRNGCMHEEIFVLRSR